MFYRSHRICFFVLCFLCLCHIVQASPDVNNVGNLTPKTIQDALSKEARRSQDISQNGRKRIALVILGNDDLMLDKNTMKAIDLLIQEQYRPYHYEVVRSKTFIGDCITCVESHETRNPIDIPKGFSYKDHINYLSVADYCRFASDLNYDYIFIFDMNRVAYNEYSSVSNADRRKYTREKDFYFYRRYEEDLRISTKIIDVRQEKYVYRAENVRRGESYAPVPIPIPILRLIFKVTGPNPSVYRAMRRAALEEIGIVLRDIRPLVH